MQQILVHARPLTSAEFAPFGDVIETAGHSPRWINDRTCQRFDDLAQVDVAEGGGRPQISLFKATAQALPIQIKMLERHPLSSQAFFPLEQLPFLVVVAEQGAGSRAQNIHAFLSAGLQGVNYRRLTWHHPLIALERTAHFLVVDRGGPGDNCDEQSMEDVRIVVTTA